MLKIQNHLLWLAPLIFIILIAPLSAPLDLAIERYFYSDQQFQSNHFLTFVYTFGMVPGWILAVVSLLLFLLSFIYPYWKKWRPFLLLPLLTITMGAGIIVSSFKDHWGRPRPRQIEEFGGKQQFRPFYQPNFLQESEELKSFPSGHCSMGFLFFSLIFMGKRARHRGLFWIAIVSTIVLGLLLGYTRMAQGGHFFSDVILSAAVMWWTALFSDWFLFKRIDSCWV